MAIKPCSVCEVEKPVTDFSPSQSGALGVRSDCRSCCAAKARARRTRPEVKAKISAYDKAYRAANPEKRRVFDSDPEKRAKDLARQATPFGKIRSVVNTANCYARTKFGIEDELALQDWISILDEFDHACAYCQKRGVRMEMEHMTPLTRGGAHHRDNVVPACRQCNVRKSNRNIWEFLGRGPSRRELLAAKRQMAVA